MPPPRFRKRAWGRLIGVAGLALTLGACQLPQPASNQPLPHDAAGRPVYAPGYALLPMLQEPKGEILFVAAFSGGGKRSAAFAHGALRGLRQLPVVEDGQTRSLLDELDYISGVSGGSFPAMHYGLYRERSFETFPSEFLHRDINAYIYGTYLLPWNTIRLLTTEYGTNDRMAEVYDDLMFHGATYGDLLKKGLPLVAINATDVALGVSFSFTQPYFDLICSDLSRFPVARAVAASNGFPVLFSPITLTSYRQDCQGIRPPTAAPEEWAQSPDELSRRALLARTADHYLDAQTTEYVHLMDGGIADNLALRAAINGAIGLDVKSEAFRQAARHTRRVLVLSIDGQSAADPKLSKESTLTGLGQILNAVSGTQIDAYNFETLRLANDEVNKLVEAVKRARCAEGPTVLGHDCGDVHGALVHISLASVADPATRAHLQAIPTGLTIPDADVDLLVASGEQLVEQNPQIRNLIARLASDEATVAAASPRARNRH